MLNEQRRKIKERFPCEPKLEENHRDVFNDHFRKNSEIKDMLNDIPREALLYFLSEQNECNLLGFIYFDDGTVCAY